MEWEVELNKNFKFLAKQNTWASQRYRRVYMYNTNIKTKVLSESVWKKDEMGNSKRTNDQTNMKKGNLISNEKKCNSPSILGFSKFWTAQIELDTCSKKWV